MRERGRQDGGERGGGVRAVALSLGEGDQKVLAGQGGCEWVGGWMCGSPSVSPSHWGDFRNKTAAGGSQLVESRRIAVEGGRDDRCVWMDRPAHTNACSCRWAEGDLEGVSICHAHYRPGPRTDARIAGCGKGGRGRRRHCEQASVTAEFDDPLLTYCTLLYESAAHSRSGGRLSLKLRTVERQPARGRHMGHVSSRFGMLRMALGAGQRRSRGREAGSLGSRMYSKYLREGWPEDIPLSLPETKASVSSLPLRSWI